MCSRSRCEQKPKRPTTSSRAAMMWLQNEDSLERVYCLSSAFCFTASVRTAEREEPRESNEGESRGGESDNENEDSYNDEHEWK